MKRRIVVDMAVARRFWPLLGAASLLLAGCGGASASSVATAPVYDTDTAHVAEPRQAAPSVADTSVPAGADHSWTMPDLRGQDLRAAQDAVQTLTSSRVWYTSTIDLTGRGRHQFRDRHWQVCSSTPAPGETFDAKVRINFGVVRMGSESCP